MRKHDPFEPDGPQPRRPCPVKMSKPERRTVEIYIDGKVFKTMGCSVQYEIDGEVTWLARITFDEPVNVKEGESLWYQFIGGTK